MLVDARSRWHRMGVEHHHDPLDAHRVHADQPLGQGAESGGQADIADILAVLNQPLMPSIVAIFRNEVAFKAYAA
jgi:hypothetical protein